MNTTEVPGCDWQMSQIWCMYKYKMCVWWVHVVHVMLEECCLLSKYEAHACGPKSYKPTVVQMALKFNAQRSCYIPILCRPRVGRNESIIGTCMCVQSGHTSILMEQGDQSVCARIKQQQSAQQL